jgi:Uma2 family endonuclease
MATVIEPKQAELADYTQRLVVDGVSWEAYEQIGNALEGQRGLRLTYDRGRLEFMTISPAHERSKTMFGRLLEMLAWELDVTVEGAGSMTMRRKDAARGLESDECYWIQSEPAVRGKKEIDFAVDPPPDLALEIDLSRSSLRRIDIYANLQVSEIWRFDGTAIEILRLQPDGRYEVSDESAAFPGFPVHELARFLLAAEETGQTEQLRAFVEWLRAQGFERRTE